MTTYYEAVGPADKDLKKECEARLRRKIIQQRADARLPPNERVVASASMEWASRNFPDEKIMNQVVPCSALRGLERLNR